MGKTKETSNLVSNGFLTPNNGKLGIGTTNPSTLLHLLGEDSYLTMQSSSASGNAGILFKDSSGTQNGVIFYDFDDDYLKFSTNNDTEALRIDSSGNLLFGGVNNSTAKVKLATATDGGSIYVRAPGNQPTWKGFRVIDNTNDTDVIQLYSTGQAYFAGSVGIGTDNPRDPVHIFHPTNNVNLLIESGDANSYLAFRDNATTSDTAVYLGAEGNDLKFITSGTERFRITSAGLLDVSGGIHVTENVTPTSGRGVEIFEASTGVGLIQSYNRDSTSFDELRLRGSEVRLYSNTALRLDVQSAQTFLYGTSDGIFNLDTTDGRGPFIRFKENGTTKAWVGSAEGMGGGLSGDQDDLGLRAVGNILFSANGAERVRITSDGKVGINESNPVATLSITGANGSSMELQPDIVSGTNRITNFNRSTSTYKNFRLDALQHEFLTSGTERLRIVSNGDMRLGASSYGDPKTKLDIIEDQTIPFSVTANTGTFVGVMVRTRYYLEFSIEFPNDSTNTSIQLKFSRSQNAPSISIDYFSGGGYQVDHGVSGVAYISFLAASGNTLYTGTNHQAAYGGATPSWSHGGGTSDVLFKLSNIAYSNGSMCHFRINMPRGGINGVTVDRTTP